MIAKQPAKAAKKGSIALAAFQHAVSKATQPIIAYVSFAGAPAQIEQLVAASSMADSGLFVFDPWSTTNWLAALKSGRVRTVIVPRPNADHGADTGISSEPHEVFSRLYLMGTPSTAEQLAEKIGVKKL